MATTQVMAAARAVVGGQSLRPSRPARSVAWFAIDARGQSVAYEIVDDGLPALYEARPALAVFGDDAWVVYTAGHDDETFDVRLFRLGCAS